jgi:hypothetical protein
LNRRTFPDGSNCLTALHQRGFLRKEPCTNINMVPMPGHSVPLALINATIDKKVDEYKAKQANSAVDAVATVIAAEQASANAADPTAIARALISQAALLESDAASKREKAYELAPELRPGKGRPAMPADVKEVRMVERKDKRRSRDQAKAADAKVNKVTSALDAKVEAKLARDNARVLKDSIAIAKT